METISVSTSKLKKLLAKIKEQKIHVKIYNHHPHRERYFFRIEEIKDISHENFKFTILILFDPESKESSATDLKSISLLELESPIEFEKRVVQFVKVEK